MGRNNGDFDHGITHARNGLDEFHSFAAGDVDVHPHEEYLTTGTPEQRAQSKRLLDYDIAQGGGHQRVWQHIPKRSPKKPTTPYKPKGLR